MKDARRIHLFRFVCDRRPVPDPRPPAADRTDATSGPVRFVGATTGPDVGDPCGRPPEAVTVDRAPNPVAERAIDGRK